MEELLKDYILNDYKTFEIFEEKDETVILVPSRYCDDISKIFSISYGLVISTIHQISNIENIKVFELNLENIYKYVNKLNTISFSLALKLLIQAREIKVNSILIHQLDSAAKARETEVILTDLMEKTLREI
jgi:hypothetical protein